MDTFEDYYEILQVHHLAEPEVIKAAYRKLLEKYHPDHNSSPAAQERTRKIIVAFDALKDPERRTLYDKEWAGRKVPVDGLGPASHQGAVLQIDRDIIVFDIVPDLIPPPQIVTLINAGAGHLEGELIPRQKWIKISPRTVSFDDRLNIQVQIDTSKLINDIMGYADIRTNGGNQTIAIKATVKHVQTKSQSKTKRKL